MSKPIVKMNSPVGTPQDEIIYVLELPATSRLKFRKVDLEKEIEQIDKEVVLKEDRKKEIQDILVEVNKL